MERIKIKPKTVAGVCLAFGPEVAGRVLKAGNVVIRSIPWKASIQTSVRWQRMIAAQVPANGN